MGAWVGSSMRAVLDLRKWREVRHPGAGFLSVKDRWNGRPKRGLGRWGSPKNESLGTEAVQWRWYKVGEGRFELLEDGEGECLGKGLGEMGV